MWRDQSYWDAVRTEIAPFFLYIFICRRWRFIEVKLCLDILSASFKVTFGYMGCSYHNVHSWKRCFWSPDQNRYQSLALFSWKRRTSVKLRDAYESGRWLLNGDSRSTRTRLWWEAGVASSLVLGQKTFQTFLALALFVRESFFIKSCLNIAHRVYELTVFSRGKLKHASETEMSLNRASSLSNGLLAVLDWTESHKPETFENAPCEVF